MKRNIIRLMTLCTVAVLALASCKKDNKPQGNVPENGFLATVEANQGNGGRTHLVGSDVLWNAGDQIVVRNGNGATATYRLTAGENTTEGTFLSSEDDNDFFQPTYTAVYPATGNSITGEGTATITLPATQSYAANSFANGAMPMMTVSDDQTLAFKNMLGGICFPMTGDNLTVTRLVLTSNNTADHLSGVFAADYNNGQPTLSYTSGGTNSITLDCGAGVTLDATTATDFTIMLPAGSLANGFKLEVYNGESKVFEKTNDATLGADFISRSAIKKVNNALEVVNTQFTGLTFEAKAANSTVTFTAGDLTQYGKQVPTLEYSTDGETWNEYTSGAAITLANVGDKVMFRGDNETLSYGDFGPDGYNMSNVIFSFFSGTGESYVYGNVMSLLDKENYATATSVSSFAFYGLFSFNQSIYNHLEYSIELPATTLAKHCYDGIFALCPNLTTAPELPATTLAEGCYFEMFAECTSLTTAPELPTTTLADRCYSGMFVGCTNLTTAPELPATALANRCYERMFAGCTNLTTAPELPVTALAESCYERMFLGCTNLTTAPELPATTLAKNCYSGMFMDCTNLTSVPDLPATTLAENCYEEMFKNCTSLATAPELPAPTLVYRCYSCMFYGCTNLNYVKCLATYLVSSQALGYDIVGPFGESIRYSWLDGVSSTGTFVKHPSATWNSDIPSGWTVVDAEL